MREDWVEVELGEVCTITLGQSPPSSTYNTDGHGLPFFQGKLEFTYLYPEIRKWCTAPKKTAEPFDILMSVRAPVGATNIANTKCAIGRGLAAITYKYGYRYVWYYLKMIEKQLDDQGTGTTFRSISGSTIKAQPLPLAPLPEQWAIVAKIEKLFSELDNAIANLKVAKDKLEIYRHAVLKKAFEGELTKEWREKQESLPTAEELSEQIKEERQKHYEGQLRKWEIAVEEWQVNGKQGKKPIKPSSLTKPPPPNDDHNNRKWEIPQAWIWTQLGEIAFVTKLAGFEYTKYVQYDDNGDMPVIKAENAGTNGFKATSFSKVKSNTVKHLTRSQLFGGELIIVFVGAGTGNVAKVPKNQKYFLGPNIGMARPYFNLNTRYLELFFQSAFGKDLMMATVKAVAQPSLSMNTIRQSPLAFPPVQEQNQIVQEIETRLSICDNIQASIDEDLEKTEALRQSILKKAFEGKLLSEEELDACRSEPDWEPADKLLERIKMSKEEGA